MWRIVWTRDVCSIAGTSCGEEWGISNPMVIPRPMGVSMGSCGVTVSLTCVFPRSIIWVGRWWWAIWSWVGCWWCW